jgi:hypothetical protein
MTTTVLAYPLASSGFSSLSPGVGPEAQFVDRNLGEWRDTRAASLALSRFETWLDLAAVYEGCGVGDWDGAGAEPVSTKTIEKAQEFLSALPSDIPDPDVGPDPDGEVSFDWFAEPDWGVAVALNADGRLSYAAVFGANRAHGTEKFREEIPQQLLQILRRLLRG